MSEFCAVLEQQGVERIMRDVQPPPVKDTAPKHFPVGQGWSAVGTQSTFLCALHHLSDGVVKINPHSAEAADGASIARVDPHG